MFMSAVEGNECLFLSSSMNFDHFEPWATFMARWYLWILSGASICSFKINHLPDGLKWLGWWNLFLIYGVLFTGCKQDHEEGEKYGLGVLEVLHLVFGAIFLITCWVETCTVWYPNTVFTWIFGSMIFTYLLLYALTAFVVPLQTGIPFIWDHPEMVAQHAIVIVAFVTQCIMAPVVGSPEWQYPTWCFTCLCPQLGSATKSCIEEHQGMLPQRRVRRVLRQQQGPKAYPQAGHGWDGLTGEARPLFSDAEGAIPACGLPEKTGSTIMNYVPDSPFANKWFD